MHKYFAKNVSNFVCVYFNVSEDKISTCRKIFSICFTKLSKKIFAD